MIDLKTGLELGLEIDMIDLLLIYVLVGIMTYYIHHIRKIVNTSIIALNTNCINIFLNTHVELHFSFIKDYIYNM